ncbi:hypothetical protein O6H91_07G043100 [Diphasiastrum complanatum]|uniref:Uncharacterized protein n=1 Tax=Diphasiastrum complanatum TaxID=34168 RepID=A0ACC2D4K2_DIPCM|nr:hypothetical protein O6H91_07G043100 [Diphasiastrum complanatum]
METDGQGSFLHNRKAGSLKTSKESHIIAKPNSGSSSSSNSMNEWPKVQRPPLIRVVHIFNPTVIKTDAANFRSLVQKLTGKNCKSRRSSKSSLTNKKGYSSKSDNRSTSPASSPTIFEAKLPHDFPSECQQTSDMLGCFSFKDPFLSVPFFDSTDSDGKAQLSDLSQEASLNAADATKMYIPERLGIFSELDIAASLGSPEPLPDCTMLPSLNAVIDQGMRSPFHRLTSFYNSFETF